MKMSEFTTKSFLGNAGAAENSYILINYEDNTTQRPVTYKASLQEIGKAIANDQKLYKKTQNGAVTTNVSQGAYVNTAAENFASVGYVNTKTDDIITSSNIGLFTMDFVSTGYVTSAINTAKNNLASVGYVENRFYGIASEGYVTSATAGLASVNYVTEALEEVGGFSPLESVTCSVAMEANASEASSLSVYPIMGDRNGNLFSIYGNRSTALMIRDDIATTAKITSAVDGLASTGYVTRTINTATEGQHLVKVDTQSSYLKYYSSSNLLGTVTSGMISGAASTGYVDAAISDLASTGYVTSAVANAGGGSFDPLTYASDVGGASIGIAFKNRYSSKLYDENGDSFYPMSTNGENYYPIFISETSPGQYSYYTCDQFGQLNDLSSYAFFNPVRAYSDGARNSLYLTYANPEGGRLYGVSSSSSEFTEFYPHPSVTASPIFVDNDRKVYIWNNGSQFINFTDFTQEAETTDQQNIDFHPAMVDSEGHLYYMNGNIATRITSLT